jgi:1-deoxy-D-xylulose-5-phosphate synthase
MDKELCCIPIGKGEILRHGDDVAILALGATVAPALEAANWLATRGIEAEIINSRFAKPLDSKLITDTASRIKRLLTVEENVLSGGFGGSVAALLQKSGVTDVRLKSIGIPDEFVEHGAPTILRAKYGLDAKGIADEALTLFAEASSSSLLEIEPKTKAIPL